MQRPVAGNEDSGLNWSREGFAAGQTVRQIVRVSAGGRTVRIRLSNAYGNKPLRVGGATVGRSAGGALVWPKTMRRLTFGHSASAVIPAGRGVVSDPVGLTTSALEKLSVTLRFAQATGPATFHRFALGKTYRAKGDHLNDIAAEPFGESTGAWYFLSGVETEGNAGRAGRDTVVAFGDSLIDGVGSTPEADGRITDHLAERLMAAGRPLGVVNAGIGSNKLLNGSACGGDSALARFRRDVLDRPGVRSVIVHLGANDIGAPQVDDPCVRPNPKVTAEQLIAGYRQLIKAAHERGVKVIGVTIGPMKGALFPLWDEEAERIRQAVNKWVRTSGEYDSVADLAKVMADPADPELPRPGYVFMDGLHPNDAGYHALAAAIDLKSL
ncbi:SGNH/GDSL hydrolase family protein [Actinomadura barringtoniae]|uniref:SGNH/GDSL hydrolase family protein n=1 Tax=Actinomadura barringtoniae TaxID=1427535 RepID=A0A939PRN2_9ACTN|nr:SGNH/GDSL hydrolase family protein [Actinomadura barringtoniae]MBO2453511.1 SGNH/GDSL hydrolase family protein [Actinomadura barringtoniae]